MAKMDRNMERWSAMNPIGSNFEKASATEISNRGVDRIFIESGKITRGQILPKKPFSQNSSSDILLPKNTVVRTAESLLKLKIFSAEERHL